MRILSLLIILILSSSGFANDVHRLLVTGSSVVHKAPEQVTFKLGCVTVDPVVETAVKANSDKMNQMIEKIKQTGIAASEFKTGNFTISPQYTPPPREPQPDWHQTISGYEVRNTLSIKTDKLDLIGKVIDAASEAGANVVEEIEFSLQNEEGAKIEALGLAIRQAKVYAEAAAKEAGIRLGEILELNVNSAHIRPQFLNAERMTLAAKAAPTPIVPGDVDVNSTVSVVFIIRN